MKAHNPCITWKVRCISSKTKQFFDRDLVLDKSSLSQSEIEDILGLTKKRSSQNREIVKYRKFFHEIDIKDISANMPEFDYIGGFCLDDYFEDESGRVYDEVQLFSLLTGYEKPVIMRNLKSILQYGYSPLVDKEKFSQNDSDTLAHFIQVYGQIVKSQWQKEECRLIMCGKTMEAFTPAFESLVYVSVYFRQLYQDGLFSKAFETYKKHVNCKEKIIWLNCEFDVFRNQLKAPPIFFDTSYSAKDYIEAFLYGALVMHSSTYKHKDLLTNREKIKNILSAQSKEMFAFQLNGSLKYLLNPVSNAANLIHRDYTQWLHKKEIPAPDVYWHESLFGKKRITK